MIFDKKPTAYGQPSVIVPMPKAGGPSHGLPPCAIIDAGLHIQGDLATDRDVQVDGHVNGNVSCARLVKGAIRATRVMLMEGADVAGDIFYGSMSMEEGAHFIGASKAEPLPPAATSSADAVL